LIETAEAEQDSAELLPAKVLADLAMSIKLEDKAKL
jgi:hypothetical protein